MNARRLLDYFALILLLTGLSTVTFAQAKASLRGVILDEFGAVIVGATVGLTDAVGAKHIATTNADGAYVFTALPPGKYRISAIAPGFAASEDAPVELSLSRREPFNIILKIAAIETHVKVNAETTLSTDPSDSANKTVISGKDLAALPDDPDELTAALQALAGPPVGPGGGEILVDGFTGGSVPPKQSIREIRINRDPFAAENDQPSATINIFTKPGSNKFQGNVSFNFNDESLNSRNPFQIGSDKRTPFQVRQIFGSVGGPLRKKNGSFLLEFSRNDTDDNELVRATVLDSLLNPVQIGQVVLSPRRFTSLGPRIDYVLSPKHTMVARYGYGHNLLRGLGVNGFSLPERGFDQSSTSHILQLTETAILNRTAITETRFQFSHSRTESLANSSVPTLYVIGAFAGGASSVGHATNSTARLELQNFTLIQKGSHLIKFGGRLRFGSIDDVNPNNFSGQWAFIGNVTGQTGLERYQRTLQLMKQGLTQAQIRALGGGAALFSINVGSPRAMVRQFDLAPYVEDAWRYRPKLTFSYGLRYEKQNNASGGFDFAPRVAVAWAPGARGNQSPKTTLRGGAGIFYSRFSEAFTLTKNHYNGDNLHQFIFAESGNPLVPTDPATLRILNSFRCADGSATPDCVTVLPSITGSTPLQQTIWRIAPDLQVPTIYELGIQMERQLRRNFKVSAGFTAIRAFHLVLVRDINAPIPGTITNATPGGIRPNPTIGEVNQFETGGHFHQMQMSIIFNGQINSRLSVNGNYSLSSTNNDTDGGAFFPRDSYNLAGEWGRAGFDIRHRLSVFGTYSNPRFWKITIAPFIVASSAPPFNITTGIDSNQDRQFTDRPSFAAANANCSDPFVKCTQFGIFNLSPLPGEVIIPRNLGKATSSVTANVRISRSFAFGAFHRATSGDQKKRQTAASGTDSRPANKGGAGSPEKYNLAVSLFFQNIMNRTNLGPPIGNLSSPLFGQPQGLSSSFGSPNAGSRRIYLNLGLSF